MDTAEKLEDNIKTYYERKNLNIPEAEKNVLFEYGFGPNLDIKDTADAKMIEQYKLYKGYLASEKIKERVGAQEGQGIPEDSDPKFLQFVRANIPQWERVMSNDPYSENHQKWRNDKPESFWVDEEDEEASKSSLLEGYKEPSDLAYPKIEKFTKESRTVEPYAPVEKTLDAPSEEVKAENVTRRPPPTKQNFIVHTVKHNDTIEKLWIQYNVNKDIIRMANDFLGEEIYMFKTLKIPYTYGKMYQSFGTPEDEEKTRKRFAMEAMNDIIKQTYKEPGNYSKEAKYYLEINDYDLHKAVKEFEADFEFEKKVVKENKQYKKKSKRRNNIGIFGCFNI